MEDPDYRQLMNVAMRALSQRAHTTHELEEKYNRIVKDLEEGIFQGVPGAPRFETGHRM